MKSDLVKELNFIKDDIYKRENISNVIFISNSDFFFNTVRNIASLNKFSSIDDFMELKKTVLAYTDYHNTYIFIDSIIGNAKHTFKNYSKETVETYTKYLLVFTLYHEIRHLMQSNFDILSYDNTLAYMEYILMDDFDLYTSSDKYHDSISYEIGANIYSIDKTKKYLEENYHDEYMKIKLFIDLSFNKYYFEYLQYDSVSLFYNFMCNVDSDNNKYAFKLFTEETNNGLSIKDISVLMIDDDINKLDERIINSFIVAFIKYKDKHFKPSFYDIDENKYLYKHLEYRLKIYTNQLFIALKYKNKNIVPYINYDEYIENIKINIQFVKEKMNVINNYLNSIKIYKK